MSAEHFQHPADALALLHVLRGAIPDEALERFVHLMGERDRALEDHLNRHVIRNQLTARVFGNGTPRTGVAFQDVAPVLEVAMPKTFTESSWHVRIEAQGLYGDPAPASWLSFGVQTLDNLGAVAVVDVEVARRLVDVNLTRATICGTVSFAAGLAPGLYKVRARVRGQNAGTVFTSEANDTISLTVTEVP